MNVVTSTDQLIRQIEEGDTIPMLVEHGMPRIDAIAGIVSIAAGTYFSKSSIAEKAEGLSAWHAALRSRCSEEYDQLRGNFPDATRAEINATPQLVTLNGIRRGIKRAMGQGYKDIRRHRHGMEPFHRFSVLDAEPGSSE